ncbi:hypothetical protein Pcinc_006119 [Petrolisthes cinctipes]|uniref:Uncharacterized protein n=1 Tax=Petrolisthes cinctipes TaxID=88211 RepID=A0AAE1GDQ9_PETCI|nr:hypothetical protein Pcinc_006119 [Petrolisthes cinctipes]
MIILMGIRDAELVLKLISMDSSSSLNDVVTACHAHEAARRTTTAISAPNQHVQAVSTYKNQKKKNQGHIKDPPNKESPALPAAACHSCARHHEPRQCPAFKSTCNCCGRLGHRSLTP